MSVSIKISEENYRKLSALSGKLREKYEKPVSINDALSYLNNKRSLKDLAGSWDMTDEEAENFTSSLRKGWNKWKIKSV